MASLAELPNLVGFFSYSRVSEEGEFRLAESDRRIEMAFVNHWIWKRGEFPARLRQNQFRGWPFTPKDSAGHLGPHT